MTKDGGPAYPMQDYRPTAWRGMSLRDAMAIAALPYSLKFLNTIQGAASEAYNIADAMLAEREKVRS